MSLPERFFAGLGRFSVRFRWLVIGAWIAIAIIASITLPSMGSQVNNDNSQFLPSSAPSQKAATLATPLIGNVSDQSQVVIVASVDGHLTPADLLAINAMANGGGKEVPGVSNAKVVGVSTDGQAARILVTDQRRGRATSRPKRRSSTGSKTPLTRPTTPVRACRSTWPARSRPTSPTRPVQQDGQRGAVLSFLFIIVLLLLIFRSLLAPLITLLPAGIALLVSMRFIGGLGRTASRSPRSPSCCSSC